MRTLLTVAAAALALGAAGVALADNDRHRDRDRSVSAAAQNTERFSTDAIRQRLEAVGYRVSRIEAEHDCYEVRATNDSGYPIKATYDRASGELIEARLRH
jgi:hypothetical protein